MQSKAPTDLKKAPVKDVNPNLPVCRGGGKQNDETERGPLCVQTLLCFVVACS